MFIWGIGWEFPGWKTVCWFEERRNRKVTGLSQRVKERSSTDAAAKHLLKDSVIGWLHRQRGGSCPG